MSEEIADKIVRRIRAEGPLTVAAYMAMSLHDPEGGYYARRGPIGDADGGGAGMSERSFRWDHDQDQAVLGSRRRDALDLAFAWS